MVTDADVTLATHITVLDSAPEAASDLAVRVRA